jgi:hypothetical protein
VAVIIAIKIKVRANPSLPLRGDNATMASEPTRVKIHAMMSVAKSLGVNFQGC